MLKAVMAMVVAGLILVGCGGGDPETTASPSKRGPRELHVTLDGYEGAETLGLLMAEQRGYFADYDIFPLITTALSPDRPVQYVVSRSVDLGVTHLPQVVMAREKGAHVVAVGSLIPRPTASMIWLKGSKIGGIADLRGKTIAIPGAPFQKEFLGSALARAGLTLDDVKVTKVRYDMVPALVSGRADAIFGGSSNLEGAALESRGLQPVITPARDLDLPSYDELVLIARPDRLSDEPRLFRDFMAAVARGTAAAIEDPEAAARLIGKSFEADPNQGQKAIEAEVESTLPLLSRTGHMSPGQAGELVDWMHEEGMIQRKPSVSELLTDDYLAKQP